MSKRKNGRKPEDSPVAWFVVLEQARSVGDFERAAYALRKLAELGVRVTYVRATATDERAGNGDAQ